jgi:hypothetical protein
MTETRKCREYSPAKNTLVRLTKPSKASSINDPFISCGNSIAVNWLPNDSKKYDVNIVARFGDTYYGTNLPMTSTAMNGPSLDENNGSLN